MMLDIMTKIHFIKKNNSRGAVSLIMAMIVLSIILTIALGSSFIISSGLSASLGHGDSTVAFYAAETGVEQALFDRKTQELTASRCPNSVVGVPCTAAQISGGCCPQGWNTSGNATYCLVVSEGTACDYTTISNIQSIGEYKNTRRSINVTF